ncbi:MAG TPA: hypothetical protein VLT87_25830 [Thermoanaerobaculia bacterium]|nr:hypothetical protein [Thermoanaerobaculia bacterium]
MNEKNRYYIVGRDLEITPVTSLLAVTAQREWGGKKGSVQGSEGGPPIAVSPDGTLAPGVLYESSTDPRVRYYLPAYQLRVVDGRYTTRLRWRGPEDDPEGPLAFLDLELAAEAPPAQGFLLQEIEHQAVVRIGYQMVVEEGGSLVGTPPLGAAAWAGEWINVDAETRGMTRVEIAVADDGSLTLHGFGKCHPTDCDWGVTPAQLGPEDLVGTYDFGWKKTVLTLRRSGDQLFARVLDDYSESDGRTDRTTDYVLARGPRGGEPVTRPTLWIEAGALEPAGPGIRRCRLPISTKPDFDRLYQIMTEADLAGRLEIRAFATIGHRTWRQIVIGDVKHKIQVERGLLVTKAIDPKLLEKEPPTVVGGTGGIGGKGRKVRFKKKTPLEEGRLFEPGPFHAAPQARERSTTVLTRDPAAASRVERVRVTDVEVDRAVPSEVQGLWIKDAVLERSDVLVKVDGGQRHAIPTRTVLDRPGVAALLRVPAEARQEIAPFFFPLATNSYVFDVPGDLLPTTHHILIRNEIHGGDGGVLGVFYQDSAFPDQFYYQPQEFRLPRLGVAPYLPDLRVVFFDVLSVDEADAADEASLHYRVQIVYRARPYIDPGVLDRLQQQVPGSKARFTALVSESSRLTLRLPEDEAEGRLTEVPRTDAEVRLEEGIVDCIELSQTEFERIFSFFQAPSGLGLEGDVEATLLGNTMARIPVRLSLRETAGPVFDYAYRGPVDGGLHRVTLHNRLESAVRIDHFHRVTVAPWIFAHPQTLPGAVVPAGGTLDVDYRVSPEGAVVADLEPVLSTHVESDPAALWPRLFSSQGYTNETFTVEVSVEPEFFGAGPQGGEPLTGVDVDFDSGATVTLTAAAPRAVAELRMPLLSRLLNAPEARQYRYQVTNLHGDPGSLREGVQTDWIAGEGDTPLSVVPAGA